MFGFESMAGKIYPKITGRVRRLNMMIMNLHLSLCHASCSDLNYKYQLWTRSMNTLGEAADNLRLLQMATNGNNRNIDRL